jgi:putative hemolysin
MQQHGKRYLFGCCSLTSQDGREGQAVLQFLEQNGHMHPNFFVPPRAEVACPLPAADDEQQEQARQGFIASRAPVPRLFRIYLSYGTKACGPPAIDRHFKTIDYFVVLDIETLDERTRRFFAPRQK